MVRFNNVYKGKKVLVTGYQGFCGSWLCAWLRHLGAEVYGCGHSARTTPNHFSLVLDQLTSSTRSSSSELLQYQQFEKCIQSIEPDVIFHLAAKAIVAKTFEEPRETFENNIMSIVNILEAVRVTNVNIPIIVVTSDKVYEDQNWQWGYRENDELGGVDPYSASKTCIEHIIRSYRKCFDLRIGVARAGNVIGGGDWSEKRLIPDIVRATVKNETVMIHTPESTRPWQHVLEALQGYLLLGEYFLAPQPLLAPWDQYIFNFGPNDERSVLDILKIAQKVWPQVRYKFSGTPTHPHMVYKLLLDSTISKAILDWTQVWPIDYAIRKTIEWYRDFYEKNQVDTLEQINEYEECLNDYRG